jgi:hypothetical protein
VTSVFSIHFITLASVFIYILPPFLVTPLKLAPRKSIKAKKEKGKELLKEKPKKRPTLRPGKLKNAQASKAFGHGAKKAVTKLDLQCSDRLCSPSELQEIAGVLCAYQVNSAIDRRATPPPFRGRGKSERNTNEHILDAITTYASC